MESHAWRNRLRVGFGFSNDLRFGAGLVIEVNGNRIVTIEGNTNPGGSSDGFGVFRRDARAISSGVLLGYLDFCDI